MKSAPVTLAQHGSSVGINMTPKMLGLIFLLLLGKLTDSRVPFYCKRFRGDCSARRDSICCKALESTTTTTTTTTVSNLGSQDVDAPSDIFDIKEEEDYEVEGLIAEQSEVKEVFVLPEDPSVNTIDDDILDSTAVHSKPSPKLPRFCKLLKFNCGAKSNHPCCPKLPRVSNKALSTTPKTLISERKYEKDDTPKSTNDSDEIKEKLKFESPKNNFLTKPRDEKKPDYKRSSFYSNRNKNRNKSKSNKSFICRIVNCQKNKRHKCCLDSKVSEVSDSNSKKNKKSAESVTQLPSSSTSENKVDTKKEPSTAFPQETEVTTTGSSLGIVGEVTTVESNSQTELNIVTTSVAQSEETTLLIL